MSTRVIRLRRDRFSAGDVAAAFQRELRAVTSETALSSDRVRSTSANDFDRDMRAEQTDQAEKSRQERAA